MSFARIELTMNGKLGGFHEAFATANAVAGITAALCMMMPSDSFAIPIGAGPPPFRLDVTYTNGSIIDGPLLFGLSSLPSSVSASFVLRGGVGTTFGLDDIKSFQLAFGDALWTELDLTTFNLILSPGLLGVVSSLRSDRLSEW